MQVLFTFHVREQFQQQLRQKFPQVSFRFNEKVEEVLIEDIEILVTYGRDVTEEMLERSTSLKWIMVASAGVDKMPLQAIAERNILVSNVRGIHKIPMAETVLAHILALSKGLPTLQKQQQRKEWKKDFLPGELYGQTAIIIGPGAIGAEIARLLRAFGVYTIGCNRSGKPVEYLDETVPITELQAVLPQADYIISILPSTAETACLLTEAHFKAMKETAVFLNFGRGDVVKEQILIDALESKEIGHAVLDVFEVEPLPESSALWNLSNVTISPHISGLFRKYVERSIIIFEENLEKWLADDHNLRNIIDLKKGY